MRKDELEQFNRNETEEVPPIYQANSTIRARLMIIIFYLTICFISMYFYKQINPNGYWLDELLNVKMNFLHVKLNYNLFAYPLRFIGIGSILYVAFIVLQQWTTKYTIYDLVFEKAHGVFNRERDPLDFIKIKDVKQTRSFLERILGIGTIIIYAPADQTTPELHVNGLDSKDSDLIYSYLKSNAVNNYTEYKIKQDMRQQRNKIKTKKNNNDVFDLDDSTN